jgi:hypothetical protein
LKSRRFTLLVMLVAGLAAAQASAQVRQMETVGAYPLTQDAQRSGSARDTAVKLALDEAVIQVAMDLVTGLKRDEAADFLPDVLGDDPLDYISRFRIIEDRGERPTQYSQDPKVEFEYVVLVESHLDSARIKRRLEKAGLLMASARGPARQLLVVIDGNDDFDAYEVLRRALVDRLRVKSAVPVEMERGRIVLAVETSRSSRQLLENLLRNAPPELLVTPVDAQAGLLKLRIELQALPEGDGESLPGAPGTGPGARN